MGGCLFLVHADRRGLFKGCRSLFGRGNGVACLKETSGLCGKRTLPPLGTGSRVKPGMTRFWDLVDLFRGLLSTISPFHLSTSKTPFHLQRSCHPRSISFSPPHHDITTPRSPVWIPLSFAATGFGGIILRYVVAKLRMTPGKPQEIYRMQKGAKAARPREQGKKARFRKSFPGAPDQPLRRWPS
ncbi:MAG: hypothetical protein BWX75_00831 [Candidatus Cloacimonetes bacterium ADurb.Bin088]|jgi:hypothetical protein|nr:MAG: hypothetical protein BWX75_00831 [Candidatus Cloacimonetes bacterium ADurb.Bin088]